MRPRRSADDPLTGEEARGVIDLRERPLPPADAGFTVDWQLPIEPDQPISPVGRRASG